MTCTSLNEQAVESSQITNLLPAEQVVYNTRMEPVSGLLRKQLTCREMSMP